MSTRIFFPIRLTLESDVKRGFLLLLGFLLVIVLASCNTTEGFVSDVTLSHDLTLSEKLDYYGGTHVKVDLPEMYFSGDEWYSRMLELIGEAEDYILLSTFLGSSAPSIEPLYDLLAEKAESGVEVYIIIDGTSNLDMTETRFVMTPLNYLRESGVNLLIYSPLSFTHLVNPASIVVRDHRKMMVIDGKIAAIGGMNNNYISIGAGEKSQRDSMYVFSSTQLSSLFIDEFVSIWNESSVDKMDADKYRREDGTEEKGESYDAWLFNRNVYKGNVSLSGMYGSLIAEADESIFLCPYLPTLDEKMMESIKDATKRGVDTEIWCSVDSRGYARAGGTYAIEKLISETGVTYYDVSDDENGRALPLFHMKAMVIDDRYVVIGSANFNYRSMTLSHELALVIDSPEMASTVKASIKEKAVNPVLLTEEDATEAKKTYGSLLCYLFTFFGG